MNYGLRGSDVVARAGGRMEEVPLCVSGRVANLLVQSSPDPENRCAHQYHDSNLSIEAVPLLKRYHSTFNVQNTYFRLQNNSTRVTDNHSSRLVHIQGSDISQSSRTTFGKR